MKSSVPSIHSRVHPHPWVFPRWNGCVTRWKMYFPWSGAEMQLCRRNLATCSLHPDESPLVTAAERCPEYEMCITVAGECMMKDVRAMLALGNLEALGTVLSVHPPREGLDEV